MLLRIKKDAYPKSKEGQDAYNFFIEHPNSLAFVLKRIKDNRYLICTILDSTTRNAVPIQIGTKTYYENHKFFILSEFSIFDNVYDTFPKKDLWMSIYLHHFDNRFHKHKKKKGAHQGKPYRHSHNDIDFPDEKTAYYAIKYPYRGF